MVTHGKLAQELLSTCEMIIGKQENAAAIGLMYDDDINALSGKVREKLEELDQGEGVIVCTDLYGGSPNTHTAVHLKTKTFQQITGVNMPMLLELFSMRDSMAAPELAAHIADGGIQGIKIVNELLKAR